MSDHQGAPNVPLSDWQVEFLRLTAFTTVSPTSINMWEELIGEPPENQQIRKKEQAIFQVGSLGDHRLTCLIQPPRIEWRLIFSEDADQNIATFQDLHFDAIGGVEENLHTFQNLMEKWLQRINGVNRLAFGAVLLHSVADRSTGYKYLGNLLTHVSLDADNATDFMYRINWPCQSQSGVDNLSMNRLSTWSIAHLRQAVVSLRGDAVIGQAVLEVDTGDAGQKTVSETSVSPGIFAARLELDINTSQNFVGNLPSDQLDALFSEMGRLGLAIATRGEMG